MTPPTSLSTKTPHFLPRPTRIFTPISTVIFSLCHMPIKRAFCSYRHPSFLSIQHVENEEREHRREGVLVASSMYCHPAERSLLNAVLGGRTPLGLTIDFLSALLHLPHVFVLFFHPRALVVRNQGEEQNEISLRVLTRKPFSLPSHISQSELTCISSRKKMKANHLAAVVNHPAAIFPLPETHSSFCARRLP